MTLYIWSEFKARVLLFLTDRTPNDTNFTSAVAEYVRARIARDMMGSADAYGLIEKRYTSMRRGLVGYNTTLSDAALQEAVRVLLSEGGRTNTQFAQAVAFYIRAETAREVEARGDMGPEAALTIAKSCRNDYLVLKLKLCGFQHTFATTDLLAAEVNKFLPVDSLRLNTETYRTALQALAVEDIEAYGTWLNQQIATAKDDLQALSDRVQLELRTAVIDLQRHIRAYTVGHTTTLTEDDITPQGNASFGSLPDGAQVRSAKMEKTDVPEEELSRFDDLYRVPWDRRNELIQALDCSPRIAIDPKGVEFLVSPPLTFARPQLIITWDGTKLEFEDGDSVPFDEAAVPAVGYWINAALASEWGESVSQVQIWTGRYIAARTDLYLRHKDMAEVKP